MRWIVNHGKIEIINDEHVSLHNEVKIQSSQTAPTKKYDSIKKHVYNNLLYNQKLKVYEVIQASIRRIIVNIEKLETI